VTEAPPRVRHRLLIRHPSDPAILLADASPTSRLPSFVSEDRHTAEVDYINAAVRHQLGVATTVLRSHAHGAPRDGVVDRVHELVAHDPVPVGLAWCPFDVVASRAPYDADAIGYWRAASDDVVDGAEWMRPEWFAEASDWIGRTITDVREIVQLRTWMSSCVLRVHAASGDFYFKAVAESLRAESGVTAYLAQHFPHVVARVVAAEPDRRWFLMAALPGVSLEDVPDVAAWEAAAAGYARVQADCRSRVEDLRSLGCPTRTLEAMAESIVPFASGAPDGLTPVEAERFRALAPGLRERCAELAALDVPLTLEHGDLWPSNFLVAAASFAIIDWEDVGIGHPFLSLAPFLAGLAMSQPRLHSPQVIERIERAYLTGFVGGTPPASLSRALRLAAPLAFVGMALVYRAQRPSVVRLHPWMSELVPQAVRLALTALDADRR
jgi:hypothetical protein